MTNPSGLRAAFILAVVAAAFIPLYWVLVFTGVFPVVELVPGYRNWFMPFVLADSWIATWAAVTVLAIHRRSPSTYGFAVVTGSSLVFLGLYALGYGALTGLLFRLTLDELIEIAIKIYCLAGGGWLVWWGLRSTASASKPTS